MQLSSLLVMLLLMIWRRKSKQFYPIMTTLGAWTSIELEIDLDKLVFLHSVFSQASIHIDIHVFDQFVGVYLLTHYLLFL